MNRLLSVLLLALIASLATADDNLVRNADFTQPGEKGLPAEWAAWMPLEEAASCKPRATAEGLRIDSAAEPFSVGGATQELRGVQGGKAYAIDAQATAQKLASPLRSVMIRITWTHAGRPTHPGGMLVRGPEAADGPLTFHDVFVAPADADGAKLSLELKWPQGGSVTWRRVSVRPTDPPPARKVKVGTVYLRPRNSTPQRNVELYCEQIDAAGRLGLDIVCLPEAITQVGTPKSAAEVAEPIPGPAVDKLAEAAKRNHLWVVACLNERDGPRVYNAAVLLGRDGRLAGKYRKVHLPREEWQKGVIPGGEYPVFQTDFGKVAVQFCYDWFFPEIATIWGLKGAEIVFAPTWGTTFPDREGRVEGETVFRVRARDNGYYLVPSVFDGNSMVIDPLGRILATSNGQSGVFWHEIDLSRREPLEWVGHWGSIGPRDRMPESYGAIVEGR